MKYRILALFIGLLILVVAMRFYSKTVAEKESLWRNLSDTQYSNLAQCLDYAQEVPDLMKKCEEIEKTVVKTLRR